MLGSYHMANPGQDIFNTSVDDVLAPKRQAEIAQLIEVLKRFRPTKVAVERNAGDQRTTRDYEAYLAGKHELTRNEIEQIGYRLAKELGHQSVYTVDADGEFPYPRVVGYAKANGQSREFESLMGEWGELAKSWGPRLASGTILDALLYLNSDERVAKDVGFYYRVAHFGVPYDWAGADLLADWYRGNTRIYTNTIRLIESPSERVLVLIGSGHLGWLRQMFGGDPTVRLRKLAEFGR